MGSQPEVRQKQAFWQTHHGGLTKGLRECVEAIGVFGLRASPSVPSEQSAKPVADFGLQFAPQGVLDPLALLPLNSKILL